MYKENIQRYLLTPKLLTILCLVFLLALSACNSSEPDDPTPTPQVQDEQNNEDDAADNTDQDQSGDNEDTGEPEPVDNDDDTAGEPAEGSVGQVQDKGRIEFDSGATGTTIAGELAQSSGDSYILSAAAGQIMTLSLDGPTDASIGITNADGLIFEPTGPISFHVTDPLPTTGDYMVTVASGSGGSYELMVTIDNKGSDGSAEDDQEQAQEDTIEKEEEEGHGGDTSLPDGVRINTTLNPLGDVVLVFKGLSQDGNFVQVENIDIYKAGELSLLQTIPFRSETEVPVQPPALVIEDVNFDGFTDLGVPLFTTAGSNLPVAYFLWDSTINQFVRNQNFDVLMAPTILEGKRILTTSRAGAGDVYYTLYAIGKGGPRAIAAQNCEVTQNENGEAIIRNQAFSIDEFDNLTLTFESITTEEGCLEFKDPR